MNEERRINFRVTPEMFDRLDDKRHMDRTSWQALGVGLFTQWLDGLISETPPSSPVTPPADDRFAELFNTLARVLENANPAEIAYINAFVEMISANHQKVVTNSEQDK